MPTASDTAGDESTTTRRSDDRLLPARRPQHHADRGRQHRRHRGREHRQQHRASPTGTGWTGDRDRPRAAGAAIQTGNATGQGSVDTNGISQEVNATVTENGTVVVVQVAIIVNIGIGLAGSGGNIAGTESATPPAGLLGRDDRRRARPPARAPVRRPPRSTPAAPNATGNTGSTQVTQSIVLTGNDVASQLAAVLNIGVGVVELRPELRPRLGERQQQRHARAA